MDKEKLDITINKETNEVELSGVLLKAGVVTPSGNIYTKEALKNAIDGAQDKVARGQLLGGLNQTLVDVPRLEDVTHKIKELKISDDGKVHVTAEVLDTSKGEIFKNILEEGIGGDSEFHAFSQGVGTVNEDGVVTEFKLRSVSIGCAPKGGVVANEEDNARTNQDNAPIKERPGWKRPEEND